MKTRYSGYKKAGGCRIDPEKSSKQKACQNG